MVWVDLVNLIWSLPYIFPLLFVAAALLFVWWAKDSPSRASLSGVYLKAFGIPAVATTLIMFGLVALPEDPFFQSIFLARVVIIIASVAAIYSVYIGIRYFLDFLRMAQVEIWELWKFANQDSLFQLPDSFNPLYEVVDFKNALSAPTGLKEVLVSSYGSWLLKHPVPAKDNIRKLWDDTLPERRNDLLNRRSNVEDHARAVNHLIELVPSKALIQKGDVSLYSFIQPALMKAAEDDSFHAYYLSLYSLGPYAEEFKRITVGFSIPEAMRVEHMQIVASPGHGKSTLLTQMFFDDLERNCAIVLIDSQGDLISQLAERVPLDRLILIDPVNCPPPLNIFAQAVTGEQGVTNALALFEYVFASLGVTMTGRQEMMYRYLSRLCMMVPGGSILTLRDILQPNGTDPYVQYIEKMNENAQVFFQQFRQTKNNQYSETRQEVLVRLLKVLENPTFSAMLGADRMAIDIPAALNEGKVILVSTAKNQLDKGAALLGRIFVAQVMQAVRNRPTGFRRRVYLYIDEFADYAEDSDILLDCFAQGRKYELGMIVAHQNLGQLTPKLSETISSSTAIKFAGGVSDRDVRALAGQMRTTTQLIDNQPKGTFLAHFKDIGTLPWPVQFGFIDTVETEQDIEAVHDRMKARFGTAKDHRKKPSVDKPAPPQPADAPDKW